MKFRLTSVATALIALLSITAASARFPHGTIPGTSGWMAANVGGGGFVTTLTIANDGTKAVTTDTYGGYAYPVGGTRWTQLYRSDTLPPSANANRPAGGDIVFQQAIAPSNSQHLYAIYGCGTQCGNGEVRQFMSSTNQGASWTLRTFTAIDTDSNTFSQRAAGQFMAVDPHNENVVVFGNLSDGTYITTNGGSSFTKISTASIPAPTANFFNLIVFDPTSATNCGGGSNQTCGIYVHSSGNGVYHSTDAGATWSLTTSSPTDLGMMKISTAGLLFALNRNGDTLSRFRSGTWATINSGFNGFTTLASDPNNASRLVIAGGVTIQTSLNADTATPGSVAFTVSGFNTCAQTGSGGTQIRIAADIPWLAVTNECFMSPGGLQFDPLVAGRLWFTEGIGVWYSDIGVNTAPAGVITWNSVTLGIEQLVGNSIVSSPTAGPLFCNWDRPIFKLSTANPPVFPSAHGVNYLTAISQCTSVDYASQATDTIVVNADIVSVESGYSNDGGVTWTTWGTHPSIGFGGGVAATDATHFIYIPNSNGNINISSNSGGTWAQICPSPVPCSTTSSSTYQNVSSSTSNTIAASGSKVFTVAAGLTITNGATYTVANDVNTMTGTVTYSGTTLTMTVASSSGSGTFSSWAFIPGSTRNVSWTIPSCSSSHLNYAGLSIQFNDAGNASNQASGSVVSCIGTTLIAAIGFSSNSGTGTSWAVGTETGWGFSGFGQVRQIVASDRVTANKVYAYNYEPGGATGVGGVYASTDSGATWSQVHVGKLDTFDGFNVKMRAVPTSGSISTAGHLIWTAGPSGNGNVAAGAFQYSTDGAVTWTNETHLCGITAFGYGKHAPGQNYPVVYVGGFYNATAACNSGSGTDVFGIWKSEDQLVTWTAVNGVETDGRNCTNKYPDCNNDNLKGVEGDLNNYGKVWVAWGGAGASVLQP